MIKRSDYARLLSLFLALWLGVLSVFCAFTQSIHAESLVIPLTDYVCNYTANSSFVQSILGDIASYGGYAINSADLQQAATDFIAANGQNALNFVNVGNAGIKKMLVDDPALTMDKIVNYFNTDGFNADIINISDSAASMEQGAIDTAAHNYVKVSDDLRTKWVEFLKQHIIGNHYYSDISNIHYPDASDFILKSSYSLKYSSDTFYYYVYSNSVNILSFYCSSDSTVYIVGYSSANFSHNEVCRFRQILNNACISSGGLALCTTFLTSPFYAYYTRYTGFSSASNCISVSSLNDIKSYLLSLNGLSDVTSVELAPDVIWPKDWATYADLTSWFQAIQDLVANPALDRTGAITIPGVATGDIAVPGDVVGDDVGEIVIPRVDPVPTETPTAEPTASPSASESPSIDIDDSGASPLMDLSTFFPFCLPMDFYLAIKTMFVEPEAPVFEIPLSYDVLGKKVNYTLVLDVVHPDQLHQDEKDSAEQFVKFFRWFQVITFIIALIFISIKIIPK